MACQDIDLMRRQVCGRLRGTVNTWHSDLQSRYGDPRVYALQQQQMNRVDAALAHDLSRRNSTLLNTAYEEQRTRNRTAHEKRITTARDKLRTPGRRDSTKRPGSEPGPAQTPPPPQTPPPAQPAAPESAPVVAP